MSGREIILGVKKSTTWGTPVAAGANDGVLCLGFDLGQALEPLLDQPLGVGFDTDTQSGRETSAGTLRAHLRYDGMMVLLALAMGQAGAPTQQAATLAYLHTLQLTDGVNALFATMAMKKKSDLVHEFPGVKIAGFTIRGGMRIPTEVSFDLVGSTLTRNGGSGTNNTTTIATVTYRTKQNRVVLDENAYVRVNAASAGALAASDNIYASEFTLTFRRPLEGDHVLDQTSYIDEPTGTGFPEATLALSFPQFRDLGDTLFWANFVGTGITKTAMKIEIFSKGGVATGAENYRMLLQMPQAYVMEISANPDGPGKITNPVMFRLTQAASAPTGMTGVTNPFALKMINLMSTDPLA